ETPDIDLTLADGASGSVSGTVTFLATQNIEVDVSLTHPLTKESIPGLNTTTSSGKYSIANVPDGKFLARASFVNDAKVMDPDWIVKNGEPFVIVSSNAVTRDFSVTGAIAVVSPTNVFTSTTPVETTTTPTFEWDKYSSTSDYVIEVRNANGILIWGGFSPDWSKKNIVIPSSQNTVLYDFDASATEPLVVGKTYRWRVYASKDAGGGASWDLISASEEQMGLFKIVL
ncbi:MAG: carboxypeptidase regulatory-like domain-containing protein, partial [Bacteroidetes bacterium]|nr:carboxypeptidase regulatory-like domain-containing protein [Bacteroidota bacterium]